MVVTEEARLTEVLPDESPSLLPLQGAALWGPRRAHPQTCLQLILSGKTFSKANGRKPNLKSLKL